MKIPHPVKCLVDRLTTARATRFWRVAAYVATTALAAARLWTTIH